MLAEGERYRRDLLNTAIAEIRPAFLRELNPEIQCGLLHGFSESK